MLIQGFWLEGRRRSLTVHLPGEGIPPVTRMLDAGCVFHDLLPFRLRFEALREKRAVRRGGVKVTPHPTTHLGRLRARFQVKYGQAFESFSFLLESNGLRVAHSADLGEVEDLSALFRKPVDLLVCELAHCDIEALTAFLRRQPVRRVLFVHLARELRGDLGATRERIGAGLRGIPFSIAEDGERVTVVSEGAQG